MKSFALTAVLGSLALLVPPQRATVPAAAAPPRVGVYDPRGVAIAYAGSKWNAEVLAAARKEFDEAKQKGAAEQTAAIEARMRARQEQFHQMGFGRADVSSLLDPVRDRLPALADAAGVDVIVDRFEVDWQRPGVELVNVTEAVAKLYGVDERTLGWVRDLQAKEPLPAGETVHD